MTERFRGGHRHAIGLTRRELLQVGYSGLLGMGIPSLWTGQASGGNSGFEHEKGEIGRLDFLDGRSQPPRHV